MKLKYIIGSVLRLLCLLSCVENLVRIGKKANLKFRFEKDAFQQR